MKNSILLMGNVWIYSLAAFISAACVAGICADSHAATGTNGNQPNSTDVGIWYCTYYGDDWNNVGGMAYRPTMYKPLCSDKPNDYRAYNAADISVIDFHLRHIANAKIDFILFELTPGGLEGYRPAMNAFVQNARITAKRIKAWNDNHQWKIRYAIAAGSHPDVYGTDHPGLCMEKEAEDVYKSFYNNEEYGGPDNYYQLNGKPLIVYWGSIAGNKSAWASYTGDKTFGEKFTIRYASDVVEGSYGWNIYNSGTVVNSEVEVVSPGWGHYVRPNPPYVSRRLGDFYRNCWHTVLNNPKPQIVMITAFNDYLENTAVWTADTADLTDADKWYGHDEKPHPWMYWDITVSGINALRGIKSGKIKNIGTGKLLDALDKHNGEKPYIWEDADSPGQRWQIVDINDGLSKIVNNYSGQVLDIKQNMLIMNTDTDAESSQWRIVDIGGGFSKIINASTGMVLDCRRNFKVIAACVSQDTGSDSQKWLIEKPWTVINDNEPSIIYGTGWGYNSSATGFINNDCHTSNIPGSYMEFKFKGSTIRVIGDKDTNHGMFDVYIDGVLADTADAYNPVFMTQQELYVNTGLSDDEHTIKIVISGDKNPKASGYYQSIDAFKLI